MALFVNLARLCNGEVELGKLVLSMALAAIVYAKSAVGSATEKINRGSALFCAMILLEIVLSDRGS